MPDILINTENIYLKRGICELLIEIAIEENICTPFSLHEYSSDIISQTDVLFTEMETGEHYLCHPYFKKIPQQTPVFVFVPSDSCAGLTVCRFVCVMPVLSVSTPISAALKSKLQTA